MTSSDGRRHLSRLKVTVTASSGATAADAVAVAPRTTGQRMIGFGAALTHSSAAVIATLPTAKREALLRELFSPNGPVRLTVLRIPIGASDFVPDGAFTLDDRPPGQTDWDLEHFSTAPDRDTLQPLLKAALRLNPHLTIVASPWSPPAWLKTPETLEGGRLRDEQRAYDTYARYLTRFVQDYRKAGIPIGALTVQNEPQLRTPSGYPGMDLPVAQEARLIEALGPALRSAGLDTDILGYDHNWALAPGDAASTPPGEDPAYQYPSDLLGTAARRWIAGIAYHCYSGDASAQSTLHTAFPTKQLWVTECSGSHSPGADTATVFAETLDWQAKNLLIPATRNGAAAVLTFNLALDPSGGPHSGGCDTCTGVVTIAADGGITRNAEYYVLAHAARWVPNGAVEVASDSPPGSPVQQVAFRRADGRAVVVAYNAGEKAAPVTLDDGSTVVSATLPARSLGTVVWGGGG